MWCLQRASSVSCWYPPLSRPSHITSRLYIDLAHHPQRPLTESSDDGPKSRSVSAHTTDMAPARAICGPLCRPSTVPRGNRLRTLSVTFQPAAPGWSPSHNRVGHRTLLEPRRGGAVEVSRRDESRAFRRLRVRRSSSESPPQTPLSWRDSTAHLKQVSMTSQRRQTALASSIWRSAGPVFPLAKNSSGSSSRQAPLSRHVIRSRSSNMRYRGFAIMGVSSAYRPDSLWPAGVKVDTRKPYPVAAERASRTAQASVRTP